MLFEHAPALPKGEGWEYDFSWPGERVLAMKDGGGVRLVSVFQRRDLTNRFPVVAATVAKIPAETAVIDGVIRAVEPHQLAAFANAEPHSDAPGAVPPIRLVAMDLLWRDGVDLRQLELPARRAALQEVTGGTGILQARPPIAAVPDLLAEAQRLGADGVIARRRGSRYRPFARTGDWVRVVVTPERPERTPSGGSGEIGRFPFQGPFGLGQMA